MPASPQAPPLTWALGLSCPQSCAATRVLLPPAPFQVSMLPAEMLQYIVEVLTTARGMYLRDRLKGLPAGDALDGVRRRLEAQLRAPLCGLQLVLVGDFLQVCCCCRRCCCSRCGRCR